MDHEDGPDNLIIYDLATLTWSEVLRVHLRGRFPRARNPVRRWVVALLGLTLCLAGLGLIVGLALWPRFRVETMAVAFGMVGPIVAVLTLSRLQRVGRRLRRRGNARRNLPRRESSGEH